MEGFITDLHGMELFFRCCRRYKIDGLEQRKMLLGVLAKRKQAKYLRDIDPLIDGKKVLHIKRSHTNEN